MFLVGQQYFRASIDRVLQCGELCIENVRPFDIDIQESTVQYLAGGLPFFGMEREFGKCFAACETALQRNGLHFSRQVAVLFTYLRLFTGLGFPQVDDHRKLRFVVHIG